jgi:hypothetical protein
MSMIGGIIKQTNDYFICKLANSRLCPRAGHIW